MNRGGLLRRLGLVLLLLAAAALIYWRMHSNKKDQAATETKMAAMATRPVPVTVAAVVAKTMPIYVTALGTVTAYNTVTVKSRVDGQLLSVPVREGQAVRQGQVLATIDARPYQAAVAQAEGQLAKDEAVAANSRAEAGRYTALYQAGVVSKESEQVQISTAGQSAGTLAADRAAIQAAKVNVAYTRITSPINGVVGLRQVDAGNIVHANDAGGLLVVTQLQPIAVIFTLPEDQLPGVQKGIRAGRRLVVEAFDRSETTHLATGTLLTVDNQIDTTTGTVKAKAVFDNRDGALFPNQFVNVRLVLEQRAGSLVVPAAAVQTGTAGNFVYVVKPCPAAGCPEAPGAGSAARAGQKSAGAEHGAPSARVGGGTGSPDAEQERPGPKYFVAVQPVVVDLTEGSQVILKSGVAAGDEIVIDGQEKLRQGSLVSPQQGFSNTGGASTRPIGAALDPSSGAPVQPSAPDQGTPEPRASGAHRPGGAKQGQGAQSGSGGQGNRP